jgi:hypothetical protein
MVYEASTQPQATAAMTTIPAGLAATAPRIGRSARHGSARQPNGPGRRRGGLKLAQAACMVGLIYAALSVYWGLGGTWLLDTIGGSIERQSRAGNPAVALLAWGAVALKIVAAALPLLALRRLSSLAWNRTWWVLAWTEAAALTLYGLVYTVGGLLIQADVVAAVNPNHRALAWHAYLWDPWFLLWGLLVAAALLRGRHRRSQAPPRG